MFPCLITGAFLSPCAAAACGKCGSSIRRPPAFLALRASQLQLRGRVRAWWGVGSRLCVSQTTCTDAAVPFALMTGSDHCRPLGADLRRPRRLLALAFCPAIRASLTCLRLHHRLPCAPAAAPAVCFHGAGRAAVQRGRAVCAVLRRESDGVSAWAGPASFEGQARRVIPLQSIGSVRRRQRLRQQWRLGFSGAVPLNNARPQRGNASPTPPPLLRVSPVAARPLGWGRMVVCVCRCGVRCAGTGIGDGRPSLHCCRCTFEAHETQMNVSTTRHHTLLVHSPTYDAASRLQPRGAALQDRNMKRGRRTRNSNDLYKMLRHRYEKAKCSCHTSPRVATYLASTW